MELNNMSHNDNFEMRVYRKNELAMMYFQDLSKMEASRSLRRWISNCQPLLNDLLQIGYNKNRKYFLRPEVELIVEHLGLP